MKEKQTTLGDVIWNARRKKGISQRELADLLNLDFTYVSKIENDNSEYPPSEREIAGLAKVLELNEDELLLMAGRVPKKYQRMVITLVKKYYPVLPEILNQITENPELLDKAIADWQQKRKDFEIKNYFE